jgi:hypothetical protein
MLRTGLAALAVVAMTGSAIAQEVPAAPITTQQGCFNMVDGLAQSWENHKYASKAQSDKIGAELKALNQLCENNAFADAMKAAASLKADIAAK